MSVIIPPYGMRPQSYGMRTQQSFPSLAMPTQIKFYDPLTGQEGPSLNPDDNMLITTTFNECGVSVNISGRKKDVTKAMALMRSHDKTSSMTVTTPLFSSDADTVQAGIKFYPMDADISSSGLEVLTPSYERPTVTDWTYISNPKNPTKVLLMHPSLSKPFSGSGVIFLEKNYRNGSGAAGRSIILSKTTRGIFEDFGGELDKRILANINTIKNNAIKEVFEESQGLFNIGNIDVLKNYVDISDPINDAVYRCYFLTLSDSELYDLENLYMENKNIISTKTAASEYRETVGLKRFFLANIQTSAASSSGSFNVNDTNNVNSTIRDRTANCLRALIDISTADAIYATSKSTTYNKENNIYSPTHGLNKFLIN